jgi:hypothetical protein
MIKNEAYLASSLDFYLQGKNKIYRFFAQLCSTKPINGDHFYPRSLSQQMGSGS